MRESGTPICPARSCLAAKLRYLLLLKADSRACSCQACQTVFLRGDSRATLLTPTLLPASMLLTKVCRKYHPGRATQFSSRTSTSSSNCQQSGWGHSLPLIYPCRYSASPAHPRGALGYRQPEPLLQGQDKRRHTCHAWHLRTGKPEADLQRPLELTKVSPKAPRPLQAAGSPFYILHPNPGSRKES